MGIYSSSDNKPENKPINLKPETTERKPEQKKKKRSQSKDGHEIILATSMSRRMELEFLLLGGATITGTVSQFDRFTISVKRSDADKPYTLFKHAIIGFGPAGN